MQLFLDCVRKWFVSKQKGNMKLNCLKANVIYVSDKSRLSTWFHLQLYNMNAYSICKRDKNAVPKKQSNYRRAKPKITIS